MLTRPRRQVLATFLLFSSSIVPTLLVVLTAWRANRPEHVREAEAELERTLGLTARLDGVRHPRPGEDVLRGVVLRREKEVARAAVVKVVREAAGVALEADGLKLRGEGPAEAIGEAAALLRRAGGRSSLAARSCVLEVGDLRATVHDLAAILEQADGGPRLSASWVAGRTRCEMTLSRAAGTTLVVRTIDGPLPARALDPLFDAAGWLGPDAEVEGVLTLRQAGEAPWEAEFRGELRRVDLAELVGRRFPGHRMSGTARLAIAGARWAELPGGQGPGWSEVRGTLTAGPGSIGAGLLRALGTEMHFRLAAPPDPRRPDVEFQGLGLAFELGRDGELKLGGALGGEFAPDAVLSDARRPTALAKAPEGAANVRGMWKALFPSGGDDLVPATAEAGVLRHLPLPPGGAIGGSVRAN